MTGSHEVRGSIPLDSTNKINSLRGVRLHPFSIPTQFPTKTYGLLVFGREEIKREERNWKFQISKKRALPLLLQAYLRLNLIIATPLTGVFIFFSNS